MTNPRYDFKRTFAVKEQLFPVGRLNTMSPFPSGLASWFMLKGMPNADGKDFFLGIL